MSLLFTCDDKATLVAYLYNEIDAADRQRVEDHLRECVACAAEAGALAGVRSGLTQWAPPQAELGFTVVARATGEIVRTAAAPTAAEPPPVAVVSPAPWWNTVPVWAQAVAAIFVLAVSAAVANVQVKSGPDGMVVTTGWMTPAATSATVAPVSVPDNGEQWKPALIALEQQLREEIRTTRETGTVRAASRSEGADEATLRRVRDLLAASESKQNRELAFRMTQLMSDINVQRRADLLRVEQAIGNTGVEMAKQRQQLNYVIRASTTPR
jgi:anti-sigma factor RsiW